MCGLVRWGAFCHGALSLICFMCVQLFSGFCVSGSASCAFCWKCVSVCVVFGIRSHDDCFVCCFVLFVCVDLFGGVLLWCMVGRCMLGSVY